MESTKEYIERDYIVEEGKYEKDGLFSGLLVAYADHLVASPASPFLSEKVVAYTRSLGQKIFALCLLDLPFQAVTPALDSNGRQLTIKSSSNALVFYKQF